MVRNHYLATSDDLSGGLGRHLVFQPIIAERVVENALERGEIVVDPFHVADDEIIGALVAGLLRPVFTDLGDVKPCSIDEAGVWR